MSGKRLEVLEEADWLKSGKLTKRERRIRLVGRV